MVAYNFQARFASDVEAGRKLRTIRAGGKRRHAQFGDPLQLYTGMRTRGCRLLRTAKCTGSMFCLISEEGVTLGDQPQTSLDEFARADGFQDFENMKQWFRDTHGLPFIGRMIEWDRVMEEHER